MPALQSLTKRPTSIDAYVGRQIRRLRKEQGISQDTLGQHLGVTFQQIQKYEKGTNRVGSGRLHQIADYFGVEVGLFFPERADGDRARRRTAAVTEAERELIMLFSQIDDKRVRDLVLTFVRAAAAKSEA